MATSKSRKVGKLALPVRTTNSKDEVQFVPTLMPYTDHGGLMASLAFALQENIPTLLIGETGVGKTSAIRHLAAKLNTPLRRVNVNGSMTAEDFVGQLLVNDQGTYWKDGVLTEAMRNGWWIVIDEINAASAEILFALHSLLDDDRYIVLTDHPQREVVKAHPDFRLFATMNPPERYAGTKELNKALLSRFGMVLEVPIPPPSIEYGDISGAKTILGDAKTSQLMNFVQELRASYEKDELEVFVSSRDIAHIVKMYQHTGNLIDAVKKTVARRGTAAEYQAILKAARLHFGATPKSAPKASEPFPEGIIVQAAHGSYATPV